MNETSQSRRRRIVVTGSRLIVGVTLIAAGVLGIALAIPASLPQVRSTPAQTWVTPMAGDATLVCPAPFHVLGRDASDAFAMQAAGEPQLALGGAPARSTLAAPDLGGVGPTVLTAPAGSPLAGAESLILAEADLRGFAAAACRPARANSWLVGGAASLGASDVVTLANPGDVPSTVTLAVFAAGAETRSTVIVPAHTQLAVPLAASVAGHSAPIVQVTADGAPVHAALQSSLMRTLDPAGVALQDDAGLPATSHVLAGVQVVAPPGSGVLLRLRLMATREATEARVQVFSGEALVVEQHLHLEERMPIEVGLDALPMGVYTVIVEAAAPVVAAAWQATGDGADEDFAWMTPAPELSGTVAFAVPAGPAPQLHLVNTRTQDAEVVLHGDEAQPLTVPAGGSLLVPLVAGSGYELAAGGTVRAAIVFTGTRQIEGWPLWPEQGVSAPLLVYH